MENNRSSKTWGNKCVGRRGSYITSWERIMERHHEEHWDLQRGLVLKWGMVDESDFGRIIGVGTSLK